MREVALISFAQSRTVADAGAVNEVEILMPVVSEAVERSGMKRADIGFIVSGSSDYLCGVSFSFVTALDAVGAWPPVAESHVEMDAAWALYEAWVKIQTGEVDSALIYGFGKCSQGNTDEVLSRQFDPYFVGPLWAGANSVAALQARSLIDQGILSERDMAEVVCRSQARAMDNPKVQPGAGQSVEDLLAEPYIASPLRAHDCAPASDGAAAVVIAAGELARSLCSRPAWIRGIDHRTDAHAFGLRDPTDCPSARLAAEKASGGDRAFDVAELHAPFSHQELLLRETLGLSDGVDINPSGGALAADPIMATGLIRIGEAASHIIDGSAGRVLGHATSGPWLQQNLVCALEAG